MTLYSSLFCDPDAAELFSDRARVQAMLDVEIALAEAEAEAGVIPPDSASAIRRAAHIDAINLETLARDARSAGNLAIPLVRQLTARVASAEPGAAQHVHVGATSQDIIDTALTLQLRAVAPLILGQVVFACDAAEALARHYRSTPMAGRTWLQQATPITFGLKAAGWLAALARGHAAIDERARTALVLQFGGAAGTLAALGAKAPAVAAALGKRLALPVPSAPWHSHRDALARFSCAIAVLVGTLGKIGKDLSFLAQTEVGEASERKSPGRGGSSSMPHKHNPLGSAVAISASLRVPGLLATVLTAMTQEHERGLGGWQAEWETIPEIALLASGAARAIAEALETLDVNEDAMRRNLHLTQGVILAEAVVVHLAERLNGTDARAIVDAAAEQARRESRSLADAIAADPRIDGVASLEEIRLWTTPETYLGQSEAFVDAMLAERQRVAPKHA